jgi:hypothetical protein
VVTPVANTPTSHRVYFSNGSGSGGFTTVPQVMSGANSTVPATVRSTGVSATTTTYVDLEIYRTNTTSTGIDWIALGW